MKVHGAAKNVVGIDDDDDYDGPLTVPFQHEDDEDETPTPESRTTRGKGGGKSLPKFPCGHCKKGCSQGTSLICGFCEFRFHAACVDGMTPEFVNSCDKMSRMTGGSAFLCVICRKLVGRINISLKDLLAQIKELRSELKTAKLERDFMTAKLDRMENQSAQVTDKIVGMEKEMETGMEKAKEEVKEEMTSELKEREEKSTNLVVYGVAESERPTGAEKQAEDVETVTKLAEAKSVRPSVTRTTLLSARLVRRPWR